MRRSGLGLAVVACCLAGPGREAQALSCAMNPWQVYWPFEQTPVPVDFKPWANVSCWEGETPEEALGACVLVSEGTEVPLTLEAGGAETCGLTEEQSVFPYDRSYLVFMTPPAPLSPDRTYEVRCEEQGDQGWRFTTRAAADPAAPPAEVVATARYSQEDEDGCCASGDELHLELAGGDRTYLEEGGLIEVAFASGEVVAIEALKLEWAAEYEQPLELPATDGPLELTPIAANGTRGPTTRIEASEIRVEAVYIPCAVSRGQTGLGLWLLAPVLWIGSRARRRRSA